MLKSDHFKFIGIFFFAFLQYNFTGSDSYVHSGLGPGISYGGREPDYRGSGRGGGGGGGAAGGSGGPGSGGGYGGGAIPLGYGGKDHSPKDYSNGLGDSGYPGGRGGFSGESIYILNLKHVRSSISDILVVCLCLPLFLSLVLFAVPLNSCKIWKKSVLLDERCV